MWGLAVLLASVAGIYHCTRVTPDATMVLAMEGLPHHGRSPNGSSLEIDDLAHEALEVGEPIGIGSEIASPLPPPDTALITNLVELEARASRGDAAAACRLAVDAEFCRAHAASDASVQSMIDQAAMRDHVADSDLAAIQRTARQAERVRAVCEGLPEGWAEEYASRHMLRAADLGDAAAAVRYAVAPPIDRHRFLERQEAWSTYAQRAAGLLQSAASRGDVVALFYLQRAYSGRSPLVGMPDAIPGDMRMAAVYGLAIREHLDSALAAELDADLAAYRRMSSAEEWSAIVADAASIRVGEPPVLAPGERLDRLLKSRRDPNDCEALTW